MRRVLVLVALSAACGPAVTAAPASPPSDPLAATLVELSRDLAAVGVRQQAAERRFLLSGESFAQPVTVPAGTCRTWTVIASPGLRDVDATLYTPEGAVLAQDTETDAHPTIQICADIAARLFMHLSAYEGAGELVLAEFESSGAVDVTSVVGGRPAVARVGADEEREILGALRRRRFREAGSPREIELPIVEGESNIEILAPLRVQRGRCYAAVATADGRVSLDVRRAGTTLAREGAARITAAQWCADTTGPVDVALGGPPGAHVRLWILEAEEARVGGESGLWLGQRP